ncbi:MBL fold metallo-hydrolase [Longimicrobium terrae]|uniref:Hydroxyacylglutathione hydrolase n=1 Tax=Longimicrobium terrae TaxID=1639882 RepID=A0A841GK43_9BACT|nr:MBL fold metallo-hydrolase [Longimicrobium terrae]MBB4634153.1 hydroxyacylglutathione hydrolase [Longimicrobium terrae]MBB6068957.1 hydroxyacylglutathione hydrolase [Longimicrobium terrae]NNC28136.1 MBL fold metallo-hydrolase [Longimicrobium terrae]
MRIILAHNPSPMTFDGTRTFLIGHERPVVIDPGPDDPAHLDAIVEALDGRAPALILLTHSHADHSAGAPELARRTGAPVAFFAGAGGWTWDGVQTRELSDGDTVDTDQGVLRAVHTPGHAPDHLCYLLADGPDAGALIAGDLFLGGSDTTLVAPPEGDLSDYLASLDRVEALRPSVLHPAHGPAIPDAVAAIARYRAHRATRIVQVEFALADGPASPGELVGRVYGPELNPALRRAAEGSLGAIIAHLTNLGRVRPAGAGRVELAESP